MIPPVTNLSFAQWLSGQVVDSDRQVMNTGNTVNRSNILLLNADDGTEGGLYLHTGYLTAPKSIDLDGDIGREFIACGVSHSLDPRIGQVTHPWERGEVPFTFSSITPCFGSIGMVWP